MTGYKTSFSKGPRTILLAITTILSQVTVLINDAAAQIVTLVDKNSTAQVDTGSSAGMFNWNVDGVNQLSQQWFWYRIGETGPEHAINSIAPAAISLLNPRTAAVTYNAGSFSIEVDYRLTGFSVGSRNSDISETIRISNLGTTNLDIHFFQYSDFDLAGTPGSDTVQLGLDRSGLYDEAAVTKGTSTVSETVVSPGANRGEAGFFNTTLAKLNDGNTDDLNNNVGPVGPGDVTWAFEWNFNVNPGSSLGISKDKYLHWDAVPEPSVGLLIPLGLAGIAFLRRKNAA